MLGQVRQTVLDQIKHLSNYCGLRRKPYGCFAVQQLVRKEMGILAGRSLEVVVVAGQVYVGLQWIAEVGVFVLLLQSDLRLHHP